MQHQFLTLFEGKKLIEHPLILTLNTERVYFCKRCATQIMENGSAPSWIGR